MRIADEAALRVNLQSLIGCYSVLEIHDNLRRQFNGMFKLTAFGVPYPGLWYVEFLFNDDSAVRIDKQMCEPVKIYFIQNDSLLRTLARYIERKAAMLAAAESRDDE